MSTTKTLKPRPVRKRTKTMTEQTYESKVTITKQTPVTLTKVQSHLPDIQVIDRDSLWEDFQNRLKINNYEVREALADLNKVIKQMKPYVDQAVTKVKELRN